jgi:hypothetical protein
VQAHFNAASGAGCTDIAGATSPTYTLTPADVGATTKVVVTGTNASGSASATSAPTAVVQALSPAVVTAPAISGQALVGQTLSASNGTWSGTPPLAYAYQWRRCDASGGACSDIAAATAQTYLLTSADAGATIRVAVTASNGGGAATASSAPRATVLAAGYRDSSTSGAGVAPSGSKPESKLWWNDGTWWADMWSPSSSSFHIFKLNLSTQTWTDTGVQLDNRAGTRADTLWDGTHLYVASHVFATCGCSQSASGNPSRLYRFSYSAATKQYTLNSGFPVSINNTQTETLVIDKDSTGTLWATWAQGNQVMVSRTVGGDDHTLADPLRAAEHGRVEPLYRRHLVARRVRREQDRSHVEQPERLRDVLRVPPRRRRPLELGGKSGDHVAALRRRPHQPEVTPSRRQRARLRRDEDVAQRSRAAEPCRPARPILLIDRTNSMLHIFASSNENGGTTLEKTSPIGRPGFINGLGTVFINDAASPNLNNATSTKQNVDASTGIVVLATNDVTHFYWHGYEPLGP